MVKMVLWRPIIIIIVLFVRDDFTYLFQSDVYYFIKNHIFSSR
jgi:hypothetical protein